MIKITGKLWLLTLCLSLIVSIPLASADKNDGNERYQDSNFYKTGNNDGTGSAGFGKVFQSEQKFYVCLSCQKEYLSYTKPAECTNNSCPNPQAGFEEKDQTTKKIFVCSSCGQEYVGDTPPAECTNEDCGDPKKGFDEKDNTKKITFSCLNCKQKYVGYTPPKKCPNDDSIYFQQEEPQTAVTPASDVIREESNDTDKKDNQKDKDDGVLHTILAITPWLLVVLCLILVWKNISALKQRLRSNESQLKKIVPPKSEGSAELNISRPKSNDSQTEERLSAIEATVSNLKEVVNDLRRELETLKKENKEEQRPQESSQWRSLHREIPANNQIIHTESTTRPEPRSNKGILTSSTNNKSGLISGTNRVLQLSPEIQKIIVAFNRMMLDSTKLDESSMELWKLRNNFIADYKVIAFKCVNSQERMNHPEEQPRFETCQPSESTLWRIKLSDGTFAVLPGLREYESTVHFRGGMKELFKSDYKSGTYRKIEMVSPAIVKRDFSINEQGELRLSQ